MATALTDEKIIERLKNGKSRVEAGIAERDAAHCVQYLDSAGGGSIDTELEGAEDSGVLNLYSGNWLGGINDLATDVAIKVDATGLYPPDFYIKCSEAIYAPIIRVFLRELFVHNGWVQETRKALLKSGISGLGIAATTWVEDIGAVIEHVPVSDFACDPYLTNFHNLRWAARRIYLPKEEAEEMFPGRTFDSPPEDEFGEKATDVFDNDAPLDYPDTVALWVYHDKEEEIILTKSEVLLRQPNHYGRVPYRFIEGHVNPRSAFPLGDFDVASGIQVQLARLTEALCSQAENSRSIPWYNASALADEASVEQFVRGKPQGFIPLKGGFSQEEAFGYAQAEPLAPALLEAYRMMQRGLQAVVGVNGFMRGDNSTQVDFATQAAIIAEQSGGRGRLFQQKYEIFLEDLSRDVLDMYLRFADLEATEAEEEQEILYAISTVEQIRIIENSASYRDPDAEMRKAIQLRDALLPFVQLGVVNPFELAKRIVEAAGDKDAETLLLPLVSALPATDAESEVGGGDAPTTEAPSIAA